MDLNSNFQSIEIETETLGEATASNETGEFVIEIEGEQISLSGEGDTFILELFVPANNINGFVGDHEIVLTLADDEEASFENKITMKFEIFNQEMSVCIKDMRDFIEPYYIQSEYDFIEGATFDEVKICCEKDQSMSNFEAMDQAIEMA